MQTPINSGTNLAVLLKTEQYNLEDVLIKKLNKNKFLLNKFIIENNIFFKNDDMKDNET